MKPERRAADRSGLCYPGDLAGGRLLNQQSPPSGSCGALGDGPDETEGTPHWSASATSRMSRCASGESPRPSPNTKGKGAQKGDPRSILWAATRARTLRVPGHLLVDTLGLLLRSSFILPTFRPLDHCPCSSDVFFADGETLVANTAPIIEVDNVQNLSHFQD